MPLSKDSRVQQVLDLMFSGEFKTMGWSQLVDAGIDKDASALDDLRRQIQYIIGISIDAERLVTGEFIRVLLKKV